MKDGDGLSDETTVLLEEAQVAYNAVDAELSKWEDRLGGTNGMIAARQRMAESWFWLQGSIVTRSEFVEPLEPLE